MPKGFVISVLLLTSAAGAQGAANPWQALYEPLVVRQMP